jgi:predicted O-linked N-acetylglucosamine transferase (SPINDLY family)
MTTGSTLLEEARRLHRAGAVADAERSYAQVLRAEPANADALYGLASLACGQGRFADGIALGRRALAAAPRDVRAHILVGMALERLERPDEALTSFDSAIACDPGSADAQACRADVLSALGRRAEAVAAYDAALALRSESVADWCNRGVVLHELGRDLDAVASFDRALALADNFADAHYNRANALVRLGRLEEALAGYTRVQALAPRHGQALGGSGGVLSRLGRHDEALASCDEALAIRADDVEALGNRALALRHLLRFDEALASADQALALAPRHVAILINRGNALAGLGRPLEAIAGFDRALAVSPDEADAHNGRGIALAALGRLDEAVAAYDRALAGRPEHIDALLNRANVLPKLGRHADALASSARAFALAPDHPSAFGILLDQYLAAGDWEALAPLVAELPVRVANGALIGPLALPLLTDDPALHVRAARSFARHRRAVAPLTQLATASPRDDGRIRIGYLSADFRDHPVAHAIADLLSRHDRGRFEVVAWSIGPDDGSAMRARLVGAVDAFHDLRALGDGAAAERIRAHGTDILVDLGGYTDHSRPGILAYRAAPLQVNFLGFPGSMGAEFVDYIVADAFALPFDQRPFFDEKIVHLPDCFFVNDPGRPIAATPTRAAAGLPEQGVVFCAFNNPMKFTPAVFDVWMRLLRQVDGSVLWLSAARDTMQDSLRGAATARGIDPHRLIFAPRIGASADHLARLALADLFLDTLPYNAHSTACDALYAGLPMVTCAGATFASRVAGSLLRAAGLPDLVTADLAEYEALALALAGDPVRRDVLRRRLNEARSTSALFDATRFRRHIEAAYARMHEIACAGEAPRAFSVEPVSA